MQDTCERSALRSWPLRTGTQLDKPNGALRDGKGGARMNRKLTQRELETPLEDLPPELLPQEAATALCLKVTTLYRRVSENRYNGAVKRGNPKGDSYVIGGIHRTCVP